GQPISSAVAFVDALSANRNSAHSVVQDRCADSRNSSLYPHSPGQRLAFSRSLPGRLVLQLFLVCSGRSTIHSRNYQAELSQKTLRGIKKRPTDLHELRERGAILILRHQQPICATISTSDELTRLEGLASPSFCTTTSERI